MVMVEKIIYNLRDASDIVLSAQSLVNEQFNINAELLDDKKKKNYFNQKLEIFLKTVQDSDFLSLEEKNLFTDLAPSEAYKKAREIILELTKQEIKNPLTK